MLFELPDCLLQVLPARFRQIGLHARRDQRRQRSVPRGVGLVFRLGRAELEPRLLGGAQFRLAALIELGAETPVCHVHARIRAFQPADLAFAHGRGARGVFACGVFRGGLGERLPRRTEQPAQRRDQYRPPIRKAQTTRAHCFALRALISRTSALYFSILLFQSTTAPAKLLCLSAHSRRLSRSRPATQIISPKLIPCVMATGSLHSASMLAGASHLSASLTTGTAVVHPENANDDRHIRIGFMLAPLSCVGPAAR